MRHPLTLCLLGPFLVHAQKSVLISHTLRSHLRASSDLPGVRSLNRGLIVTYETSKMYYSDNKDKGSRQENVRSHAPIYGSGGSLSTAPID